MPKIIVSLRSIFYYKYDRSAQSSDPEALDGLKSSTLGILAHFRHFRHF